MQEVASKAVPLDDLSGAVSAYASVNSRPDNPPGRPPGIRKFLVAPGVGFSLLCLARGFAQGGGFLNQSKMFDNFEKSTIFALSTKQTNE